MIIIYYLYLYFDNVLCVVSVSGVWCLLVNCHNWHGKPFKHLNIFYITLHVFSLTFKLMVLIVWEIISNGSLRGRKFKILDYN